MAVPLFTNRGAAMLSNLSHLTSKSFRLVELTSLKPVLVQPSGIGSSSKVSSSGEVEGRRRTVAFAEAAAKTSIKVVKSRGLVSRVLATW